MLYTIAHTALQPREICEELHYCENTSRRTPELSRSHTSLQMLHKIGASLGAMLAGRGRTGEGHVGWHRASTQRLSAIKAPRGPGKVRRKQSLVGMERAGGKERGGKRLSGQSDTITILQLADIHLDSMYTEVSALWLLLSICEMPSAIYIP